LLSYKIVKLVYENLKKHAKIWTLGDNWTKTNSDKICVRRPESVVCWATNIPDRTLSRFCKLVGQTGFENHSDLFNYR